MTNTGIEAFLAIARCKSITKAAEALCICQSSLSIRLQNLEKDLGEQLFVRQKGLREITLTPLGEEFYELALQYEKLTEQINSLCRVHRKRLRVSALNSLGAYVLPRTYERFMQKFPEVELIMQDYEVEAACKSILQGQTDIAFNTESATSDKITTAPIFSEPMVFICGDGGVRVCETDFEMPRRRVNCLYTTGGKHNIYVKSSMECLMEELSRVGEIERHVFCIGE